MSIYSMRQESLLGHAGRDMTYLSRRCATDIALCDTTRNRTQNLQPLLMFERKIAGRGRLESAFLFRPLDGGGTRMVEVVLRKGRVVRNYDVLNAGTHREVMTWLTNETSMNSPEPKLIRTILSNVDRVRRIVMEYLELMVVVIIPESYLVLQLSEVSKGGLSRLMGRDGYGQWSAREQGIPIAEDGPVVILCHVHRTDMDDSWQSVHPVYMITGVLTDTTGRIVDDTHTTTQCRETAKSIASAMGRRWSHSSAMESLTGVISIPTTGFLSPLDSRRRVLPRSMGKHFRSYIMERMTTELVELYNTAPYVLLLDGPPILTPHMPMVYSRLCVVELNQPEVLASINIATSSGKFGLEHIPDSCTETIDLPKTGLYRDHQCICGIITTEGMHDRRARLLMDMACGPDRTGIHNLVRSPACVSRTVLMDVTRH